MINPLRQYKVLLVDSDLELGQVLRRMLGDMGFTDVHVTRSARDGLQLLRQRPFDFVITEKRTQHIDGIEFIQRIRRDTDSPYPTIPIIMLAGSAEQPDVVTARDAGINEYVIKPFSAKAIYDRLERIIEHPRQFVIAKGFVGPDRRHKGTPPPGVSDRRVFKPVTQMNPKNPAGKIQKVEIPTIWMPDLALKNKLGRDVTLSELITPNVLNQAQSAIDSIVDESLGWIKSNLAELKEGYAALTGGAYPDSLAHEMSETALTLNARAGTFGYTRAAQIAYMLYLFCRNSLRPEDKQHHTVIKKFIDVLHVILGNQMSGSAGDIGAQVANELRNLTAKYSS